MVSAVTSRSDALIEQLRIWQGRWQTAQERYRAKDSNSVSDDALLWFSDRTRQQWGREREPLLKLIKKEDPFYYNQQLALLARRMGAVTIDVRAPDGKIDTEQEFIAAVTWLTKRMTNDNYVATGQKPSADQVLWQNDEDTARVRADNTPAFLRSAAEQAELAPELSDGDIARYKVEGERLGYSGESLFLYVNALAENDRWTSGKGGDPARALQLMTLAQNKRDEGLTRPRYAPPADMQ